MESVSPAPESREAAIMTGGIVAERAWIVKNLRTLTFEQVAEAIASDIIGTEDAMNAFELLVEEVHQETGE